MYINYICASLKGEIELSIQKSVVLFFFVEIIQSLRRSTEMPEVVSRKF